jgi:hypothetical protein
MPAGLTEALNRPDAQFEFHSTLELTIFNGAETFSYYFATATLNIGGIVWQPQLRQTSEITFTISGAPNQATVELQNVDTILGREFARLQPYMFGAEAKVGRYWKDLSDGREWHKVFLTGFVEDNSDNEMTAPLVIVSDIYADVSVGPSRDIRGLCQAPVYKGPECGSISPLPTCSRTLADCLLRHPGNDAFARHMGAPFMPGDVRIAIPQ